MKASILGDSHFPQFALSAWKGGRIRLCESLYEKYSRLAFTEIHDRPIAIAGLESRLVRTFETRGKYGIFECFLHRSLLWQRGADEKTMCRINFLQSRTIPTWSWMAYHGGITYMDIPFDETEWDTEISSSVSYNAGYSSYTGDYEAFNKLAVVARGLTWVTRDETECRVVIDEPNREGSQGYQCVVVGKQKMEILDDKQRHYVLFVIQKSSRANDTEYERVGVRFLPKKCINWESPGLAVRLV
jgi:hypothetical protein